MSEAGNDSRKAEIVSTTIRYFPSEGRRHRLATFRACKGRLRAGDVKKLIIFSLDGTSVFEALKTLGSLKTKIIAASFPPELVPSLDDPAKQTQAGITGETYTRLQRRGVTIVQGTMPLREVLIPDTRDVKYEAIRRTLWLVSGGMELCVEAVLMACDAGHVDSGEIVMACAADTAIVARASRTPALLSAFEVQEVICKPRRLTVVRRSLYPQEVAKTQE